MKQNFLFRAPFSWRIHEIIIPNMKWYFLIFFIAIVALANGADVPLNSPIETIDNVKPIHEFRVSDAEIMSIAISSNNDFLVIGTSNSSGKKEFSGVSLWRKNEWDSNEIDMRIFNDHRLNLPLKIDYSTQTLALSKDNKMLIGQSDDFIWKWDIQNERLIPFGSSNFMPVDVHPRIEGTQILPNQYEIIINQNIRSGLINHEYTSAKIFDLGSGKLLRSLNGAHGHVSKLGINPEGTLIAAVLNDGSAVIWDAKTAKIIKELNVVSGWSGKRAEKPDLITIIGISKDYIVTYDKNQDLKLMGLDYQVITKWRVPLGISQLKIAPNQKYLIFRNMYEGWLGIVDIKSEKIVQFKISTPKDPAEWPSEFIISNDSNYLIVGNSKGVVRIFDIKSVIENKQLEKRMLDLPLLKNSLIHLNLTLGSLALK